MGNRYARSQIILHWLTLLMVILTYAAMLLKDSVPDDMASLVKSLHFNFGLAVFLLMFIRLGLRHRYATPATTPPLEEWQEWGAKMFHVLLYVLFLALPVLGVLTLAYGERSGCCWAGKCRNLSRRTRRCAALSRARMKRSPIPVTLLSAVTRWRRCITIICARMTPCAA